VFNFAQTPRAALSNLSWRLLWAISGVFNVPNAQRPVQDAGWKALAGVFSGALVRKSTVMDYIPGSALT
jgi:hypothetical protein